MPIVAILKSALQDSLDPNHYWNDEEFEAQFRDLCFDFGLELDDVTTEKEMKQRETGVTDDDDDDAIIYKIDVPANRYDLICFEGISRGLRVFLNMETQPLYKRLTPKKIMLMNVESSVDPIRPYVVCAVLRDIKFTESSYTRFMDLQEKLHQNLARNRTLVAIGTHDLDKIQPPFVYKAKSPKDICFQPLMETRKFTMDKLFQYYKHEKEQCSLRPYLHIIEDSPVYPVIYDNRGQVLSLPPIINGDYSKMSFDTKNVFIESTATDLTKANIVLNTLVCLFSEHCKNKFHIEAVNVNYWDGRVLTYPQLDYKTTKANIDYINQTIGVELPSDRISRYLERMGLSSVFDKESGWFTVTVPPTRSDILHACDIVEDVAIGYGYNRIKRVLPERQTQGKQYEINRFTDQLRIQIALAGYDEVLTWALCSFDDIFEFLKKKPDYDSVVMLNNPKTLEFQVCRNTLIPGLLKTLSHNKGHVTLPVKIFELGDIIISDNNTDTGGKNIRYLGVLYCGNTSGFEKIHGILDRIMTVCDIIFDPNGRKDKNKYNSKRTYWLDPMIKEPYYFEGRSAWVIVDGQVIGINL